MVNNVKRMQRNYCNSSSQNDNILVGEKENDLLC